MGATGTTGGAPGVRNDHTELLSRPRWRRLRLIPLAVAAAALVSGLWAGLARIGLLLPGIAPSFAADHGALMIGGFLGTVISLERAVALGRWWAYGTPVLSAIAAIALIGGAPATAAIVLLLAGITLSISSAVVVLRQPALFTATLAIAAICWSIGTLAWMFGHAAPEVAGWWLTFLVLTIAAERLELSRLLSPPRRSLPAFVLAIALLLIGAARAELTGDRTAFSGIGLLLLTLWLVSYDIAWRTVRQSGQTRFSAICMLGGYAWLGAASLLFLAAPPGRFGLSYDAIVHTIAVGFVVSMIFGHAAIILPAVTGVRVRYSPLCYGPLALLHVSVLLRVAADLFEWIALRGCSGLLTVLALVSFAGVLVSASLRRAS